MNFKDDIKAIVFDYDGTLVNFDYTVSEYTRLALKKLIGKGYKLCLSSGRPCFLALKAFEDVFGPYPLDYIFGCNGSEMMDCARKEVKMINPLSAMDVRNIKEKIDCDFLTLGIYEGDHFLVDKKVTSPDRIAWLKARWIYPPIVYDFSSNDIERSKVIVLNDFEDREREIAYLENIDLRAYSASFSSPQCFEIVPKGVSKKIGIDILTDLLHCQGKQILSFGDMPNDMDMLLNSSGVIMDNAEENLKRQIPLHTSAVDKLGVYDFLSKNGLI